MAEGAPEIEPSSSGLMARSRVFPSSAQESRNVRGVTVSVPESGPARIVDCEHWSCCLTTFYTASRALASPYNPACRSQPLRRCCRSSRLASLAVAYTLTGGAMAVANAEALRQRGLSVTTVIALYPVVSVGGGLLTGVLLPWRALWFVPPSSASW